VLTRFSLLFLSVSLLTAAFLVSWMWLLETFVRLSGVVAAMDRY
jgi:hypothetical protein